MPAEVALGNTVEGFVDQGQVPVVELAVAELFRQLVEQHGPLHRATLPAVTPQRPRVGSGEDGSFGRDVLGGLAEFLGEGSALGFGSVSCTQLRWLKDSQQQEWGVRDYRGQGLTGQSLGFVAVRSAPAR
jgi:hypothetical protein